jgi:hypothetical protein
VSDGHVAQLPARARIGYRLSPRHEAPIDGIDVENVI